MVFPTCRLITDEVSFQANGYQFEESLKIEQDVKLGKEPEDDEDPTPDINEVNYRNSSAENIPTIWTKPPQSRAAGSGMVRFVDGQQLSVGKNSRFQISKLEKRSLTITNGEQSRSFPYSEVLSIDLPED